MVEDPSNLVVVGDLVEFHNKLRDGASDADEMGGVGVVFWPKLIEKTPFERTVGFVVNGVSLEVRMSGFASMKFGLVEDVELIYRADIPSVSDQSISSSKPCGEKMLTMRIRTRIASNGDTKEYNRHEQHPSP
jgi:hypothetical protein